MICTKLNLFRRRFYITSSILVFISPIWRITSVPFHLYKLKTPSFKNNLCYNWLRFVTGFWKRSRKCKRFTDRQMNRRTDGGQWAIKSSLELSLRFACYMHFFVYVHIYARVHTLYAYNDMQIKVTCRLDFVGLRLTVIDVRNRAR
jgi:hypothetical protein